MPRTNDKARKEARRETARRNLTDGGHAVTCHGNCRQPEKPGSWIRKITCQ